VSCCWYRWWCCLEWVGQTWCWFVSRCLT
jgi:hypothetical protein